MTTGLFESLMGAIRNGMENQSPREKRAGELVERFQTLDGTRDLGREVAMHQDEVMWLDNPKVYHAHGVASVTAGDLERGYDSLLKAGNEPIVCQIRGLTAFQLERYIEAMHNFEEGAPLRNITRVPYSLSLINVGETNIAEHERLLKPVVNNELPNTILGVLHYNAGNDEPAYAFLSEAHKLRPTDGRTILNELRARVTTRRDITHMKGKFFKYAGPGMTDQKFNQLIEVTPEIPEVSLTNLGKIVKKMIEASSNNA